MRRISILKALNRHGLTALFLAGIAALGVWNLPGAAKAAEQAAAEARDGMESAAGPLDLWEQVAAALEEQYQDEIAGRYAFIEGNGLAKRLAGFRTCNETVRLDNGDLERLSNDFDQEDTWESLVELKEYCDSLGLEFLCVLAPSKVCRYDPGLPVGVPDQVNPKADQVAEALLAAGVKVLDLRDELHKEGLDHESLFFHTDHHWTSEAAFWGYQKLVEVLNRDYGFSIDESLTDRSRFVSRDFKDGFLGSYGKRTGKYFGGVDDISVILPDFETSLKMEVPSRGLVREGDFSEAFLDWSQITDSWYYDEGHIPYAVYTGDDYDLIIHTNEGAEEERDVLFLKDSFVRPVECFLSLGVRKVAAIDLRMEPKISVKDYLEENRPDTVIFMCSVWALKDYNLIDFGL